MRIVLVFLMLMTVSVFGVLMMLPALRGGAESVAAGGARRTRESGRTDGATVDGRPDGAGGGRAPAGRRRGRAHLQHPAGRDDGLDRQSAGPDEARPPSGPVPLRRAMERGRRAS